MAKSELTWDGTEPEGFASTIACSAGPDVREAQQAAHDYLIEHGGYLRCGPVRWESHDAASAPHIIAKLRSTGGWDDDESRRVFEDTLEFLDAHPTGRLVLAMVPMSADPEGGA